MLKSKYRSLDENQPLPNYELIGHLRENNKYNVKLINEEEVNGNKIKEYHLSGYKFEGEEVWISLRICIVEQDDHTIRVTIPGGSGISDNSFLSWAAGRFGNHATLDWIGRGKSPVHSSIICLYDPLFIEGETYRDSFMFHNLSAIWAAIDWLHIFGYRPTSLLGGSWGGVYSILIACIDKRIKYVFSTFGCGGFVIPNIEKRNLWDAAIEYIGEKKFTQWCMAFDPILRINSMKASLYYETATNDKYFSLEMAMETWSLVNNKICLSILPNRDQTMSHYGTQPYVIEHMIRNNIDVSQCYSMNNKKLTWEAGTNYITCWPIGESENATSRLVVSEQCVDAGNMSREWVSIKPKYSMNNALTYQINPTLNKSQILYYLSQKYEIDNNIIHLTSPIYTAKPLDRGVKSFPARSNNGVLLDFKNYDDVNEIPVGDKVNPRISLSDDGIQIYFEAIKYQRVTRYGIRPWLLPEKWSKIILQTIAFNHKYLSSLKLFISKHYHRFDELTMSQQFSMAKISNNQKINIFEFNRNNFSPDLIVENRFNLKNIDYNLNILGAFDSVGIIDINGQVSCNISVRKILII